MLQNTIRGRWRRYSQRSRTRATFCALFTGIRNMIRLEATTEIEAGIEVCFALSLTIEIELEAVQGLRAIAGVTHGRIGLGERVTWRTRQFGLAVTHATEISSYQAPTYFQDRMLLGVFREFAHDHHFEEVDTGRTRMRDELRLTMPWFLGGRLAEQSLVRRRMHELLVRRNEVIKAHAERGAMTRENR